MKDLIVIRKRFIPSEEVDISSDEVLIHNEDALITRWKPIRPRLDFSKGISYVNLNDNYKYSRFYDKEGKFLYWYCDILEVIKFENEESYKYIFLDLLVDVIVMPDGSYDIKDVDELEQAYSLKMISTKQRTKAFIALGKLLDRIKSGDFPPKEFDYKRYEE